MATRRRRPTIEEELSALRRATEDPESEQARLELKRALAHKSWLLVSEAAKIVSELMLSGFEQELLGVWPRFVENPVKKDPGCRAKLSVLTALDKLELWDAQPFLKAVRYKQFEPALGGSVDTAGPVRLRAVYALCRLNHTHATLHAGELLVDSDPQVRAGVAGALRFYGQPGAAGLLVYKWNLGDDDPMVVVDCASALLKVAPEFAFEALENALRDSEEFKREAAALALGQSDREDCIEALIDWQQGGLASFDQELALRALGLSRLERARNYLLELVEQGSAALARSAITALAAHHYDQKLLERTRQAAAKNARAELGAWIDRAFEG